MLQLPRKSALIRGLQSSISVFRFPFQRSFSTTDADANATTSTRQKRKKGSDFLVDYLVTSIGLSRDEAISASSQVCTSHLRSTRKADLIVNLFKQYGGLDQNHIRQLVSFAPKVFSCRSLETLESKFRAFQEIGLSGSDLVGLIRRCPHILSRGISSTVPHISDVRRLLSRSDGKVAKAINIKPSSWILSSKSNYTLNYLQPNVVWLQRNNLLSHEQIEKLVISYPKVVLQRPESLQEAVRRIEGHWGIPRDSKMFFYGIIALGAASEKSVENKLNVFRSFGWSDSDIHAMVRNLPNTLWVSLIVQKLNFYMKELGYTPDYLVSHPALLTYSLEERVKPRNEVLKILREHKLVKSKQTLYSFVQLTEEKFMKVFVLPFKADLPMLYETYTKNKKRPLKA